MKPISFYCSALFLMGMLMSCSSDDNNEKSNEETASILGTWQLSQSFVNGIGKDLNQCDLSSTITLNEGGTFTADATFELNENGDECFTDKESGKYELVSGKEYIFNFSNSKGGFDPSNYVLTLKGNMLTIDQDDSHESNGALMEFAYKDIYVRQ